MSQSAIKSHNTSIDNLRWVLIIISSILLGIWATKGTIALRNILLVIGAILSIYYIILEFRYEKLKEDLPFWKLLPLILLTCIFIWVIIHFFLFSIDPVLQLHELQSTWLRIFLATLVGLGTGLALRNHPNRLNLLWLGVSISFLVLYYQYIPRALAQHKLLVPDYDHYLFHLKINTVQMGLILITGVYGALFDHLRTIGYRWRDLKPWYLTYSLVCSGLTLWAFVYIVNARNGIGLSMILYIFWFVCTLVFVFSNRHSLSIKNLFIPLIAGISLCLTLYFAFLQMTVNKGWHTLLGDVKVAIQIDRFPHWQNPVEMGYPNRDDGQMVVPSTYERVAWAVAGVKATMAYPQGVGVLTFPFMKHPHAPPSIHVGDDTPRIATHSGWAELGLAFGIPILGLIFSVLLLILFEATRKVYPTRMTILGFVVLVACLYTVGEVAVQHGIEILFYLISLISALLLTKPMQIRLND